MKTLISALTLWCFLITSVIGTCPVYAQSVTPQAGEFRLPAPGMRVALSPQFNPPILKGIKVHLDNPFRFDFILDQGDFPAKGRGDLKQQATKLIKYFLASLTIPEKDLWVNLSPYEKDRIVPQSFGQTEMGRDLLAEDYMLKQITASLIYPEGEVGKKFWKRIYEEAAKKFGTTNIPVNTFNKVWIVPQKAVVYENTKAGTAYVVESKLKVMLEEDYLSMSKHANVGQPPNINRLGSQIIREIVIPELAREINEGKNFTQLRQVYNSLILATWYKKKIKASLLAQVYEDKQKVRGIEASQGNHVNDVEAIYQRYLQAFKKGVYNYIKEEQDPITQQPIPREYFSGGASFFKLDRAMAVTQAVDFAQSNHGSLAVVSSQLDAAMASQVDQDALKRLKNDPHASTWSDGQGFTGVSLEHFVVAQRNLGGSNDVDFYRRLAQEEYSPPVVDGINTHYEDPRLMVTIIDQNGNPKGQAIREAVSNSHDALLGLLARTHPMDTFDTWMIGQFGKGVKQIIDWLGANGRDRVDVFTRQEDSPAYQLTIKNAPNGQWYIQLQEITPGQFTAAAGQNITHGTAVSVQVDEPIALGDSTGQTEADNTLRGLERSVHERFAYVKNMKITTQVGTQESYVNGWETRRFIVPYERPVPTDRDKYGRNIFVQFSAHRITITDNGLGMNAMQISRMFVPAAGDKQPVGLKSEEDIQRELDEKLALVHDTKEEFTKTTPALIFARNEEVVFTVPLPGINPQAVISGRLMLELGRLIHVQQARDKIIFAPEFDEQGVPLIQRGILEAVERIVNIDGPQMKTEDKLKYINTIIAGLEQLIAGNPGNEVIVQRITALVKDKIAPLVRSLGEQGVIILPQEQTFAQLKIPEGKGVVYLNVKLFDWSRERTLKALGGQVVDKTVMKFIREEKGEQRSLTLIAVPFKDEYLKDFTGFDADQYHFKTPLALPLINGDSFIAIPLQFTGKFLELVDKRLKGQLTDVDWAREFQIWAQLIKSAVDDQTITSYEVGGVKNTVELPPIDRSKFKVSEGQIDSQAVNGFLTRDPPKLTMKTAMPPGAGPSRAAAIPQHARMRYMIDEEGHLIDIATGRVEVGGSQETAIVDLQTLAQDTYLITKRNGEKELYKKGKDLLVSQGPSSPTLMISSKGNYVYDADPVRGMVEVRIFNVKAGVWQVIEPETKGVSYREIRFSADERFVTFWIEMPEGRRSLMIEDVETGELKVRTFESIYKHYKLHPVAPFAILDNGPVIDLSTGHVMEGEVFVHNSGEWAVTANNDVIKIHHFDSDHPVVLDSRHFNNQPIETVDIDDQGIIYVMTKNQQYFRIGVRGNVTKISEAEYLSFFNASGILEEIKLNSEPSYSVVVGRKTQSRREYLVDIPFDIPLKEYDSTKIYKHPRFNLIIDERDKDHPTAIDIKTGRTYHLPGSSRSLQLWARKGGAVVQYVGDSHSVVKEEEQYEDAGPAQFVISKSTGHQKWLLQNIDDDWKAQILGLSIKDYTNVNFDGQYFVFTNPKTRAVAYLNPQDPQNPKILPPIEQPVPATIVPPDANMKYMVDAQGSLVAIGTGQAVLDELGHPVNNALSLRPLGNDLYIVSWEDSDESLTKIKNGQGNGIFGTSPGRLKISSHGRYVFDGLTGTASSGGLIYDVSTGLEGSFIFHGPGFFTNLQVSQDEKKLTYIQGSALCIYDFETKTTKEFHFFGTEILNYTLSPNAPMAIIKYKNDNRFYYVNLNTGELIQSTDKPAVTDPQGRFTVFSPSKIYLHETNQGLSFPDYVDPTSLTAVALGKVPASGLLPGEEFLFMLYENDYAGYEVILKQGRILFSSLQDPRGLDRSFEYFQKMDNKGTIDIVNRSFGYHHVVFPTTPIKTPNKIYWHPKFEGLVIDEESNPAKPLAIDLKTGKAIEYEGEVLEVDSNSRDRRFKLATIESGKILLFLKDDTRSSKDVYPGIIDKEGKTGVSSDTHGSYFFFEKFIGAKDIGLDINKTDYPQVTFDGKYFVFTNPDNKQAVYLDPKAPDQFLKPTAGAASEPRQPKSQIPPHARIRYMVNALGQLVEIGTGKVIPTGLPGKIKWIQFLGDDHYILEIEDHKFLVYLTPTQFKINFGFQDWNKKGESYIFRIHRNDAFLINNNFTTFFRFGFTDKLGFTEIGDAYLTYDGRFCVFSGFKEGIWSLYSWDIKQGRLIDIEKYHNMKQPKFFLERYSPFAEILNEETNKRETVDVTNGELIKGTVYSVPAHNFSIELEKEIMKVHLHPNDKHSGKVITSADLSDDIQYIYYSSLGQKMPGFYGLILEDKNGNRYSVKDTGEVESYPTKKLPFDPSEVVSSLGSGGIYCIKRGSKTYFLGNSHSFKHPYLDLLIDNGSNVSPEAIDMKTGKQISFVGGIIALQSDKLVTMYDGKMVLWDMNDALGSPHLIEGTYDTIPVNFYIFKNVDGKYEMGVSGKGTKFLDIDPKDYPKVSFDGKYFVFENPDAETVAYLDPVVDPEGPIYVSKPGAETINADQQATYQTRVIERWNKDVLGAQNNQGRDYWIAQAAQGYNGILSLIERVPDDIQDELKIRLKEFIEAIYAAQEKQVRDEFVRAFEPENLPSGIQFSPVLPFNETQRRLNQFQQVLGPLMDQFIQITGKEQLSLQQDSWVSLFEMIFALCQDRALELGDVQPILQAALLGWDPTNAEQIHNTALVVQLLNELEKKNIPMETQRKIVRFLSAASREEIKAPVVFKQLKKFLPGFSGLNEEARASYFNQLARSFEKPNEKDILAGLKSPQALEGLGEARAFVVFLTTDLERSRVKERSEPPGADVVDDPQGVGFDQLATAYRNGQFRTFKEMIERFPKLLQEPVTGSFKAEIRQMIHSQKEAGGEKAEIGQNSKDVGAKNLRVEYYKDEKARESIEEATDDGPGPKEILALFIYLMSTKADKDVLSLQSGRFGTGKFTYYAGVDRVEWIFNNGQEAYMVTVSVDSDGEPRITRIRPIDPDTIARGVTVRRIKKLGHAIPELDQMLGQRSWKIFTGMASGRDGFTVSFIEEGKDENDIIRPIEVKGKELLSEAKFMNGLPVRIWKTQDADMPNQFLDKNGLRVEDLKIKEKFLTLIPQFLRHYVDELGLEIEIPLELIQNRSSYEREDEQPYFNEIRKYVAVEFYRALVYKALTDESFVLDDFSRDWDTSANDRYWDVLDNARNRPLVDMVEHLNNYAYDQVSAQELENLRSWLDNSHSQEKMESFMKFIVRLKAQVPSDVRRKDSPKIAYSLLQRRVAVQMKIREAETRRRARQLGVDVQEAVSFRGDAFAQARVHMAADLLQNPSPDSFMREPQTQQEHQLMDLARSIAGAVGFNNVLLVDQRYPFPGGFRKYDGTMFINASLADKMNSGSDIQGHVHGVTEAIVHELAHYFEKRFAMALTGQTSLKDELFIPDDESTFTHQNKGRFSTFYRMITMIALAKLSGVSGKKPTDSAPSAGQDRAMTGDKGGIDFTPARMNVQTKVDSRLRGNDKEDGNDKGIEFHLDPAELEQLQNAPGFVPVIISVRPLSDLRQFLGAQ